MSGQIYEPVLLFFSANVSETSTDTFTAIATVTATDADDASTNSNGDVEYHIICELSIQ